MRNYHQLELNLQPNDGQLLSFQSFWKELRVSVVKTRRKKASFSFKKLKLWRIFQVKKRPTLNDNSWSRTDFLTIRNFLTHKNSSLLLRCVLRLYRPVKVQQALPALGLEVLDVLSLIEDQITPRLSPEGLVILQNQLV